MPEWHVWNTATGSAGEKIARLPAGAEPSADGQWATLWGPNGEAKAFFVAKLTRAELAAKLRGGRPTRRLFSGTLSEQERKP